MSKGGDFEREFCKRLSDWWEPGRDDIFWRTAGSGGRAKRRGRSGKTTHGHHGDICATDHSGDPFVELFTVELKRGYSSHSIQDLIDKPPAKADVLWEWDRWLAQAYESATDAGSMTWMIVQRRNSRQDLVFLPVAMTRLITHRSPTWAPGPRTLTLQIKDYHVFGMTLADFFVQLTPDVVVQMAKHYREGVLPCCY